MRGIKLNTLVKVKSDLVGGEHYGGIYFNRYMEQFRGNEYKVVYRNNYEEATDKITYKLEGADECVFSNQMLEEVSDDDKEELISCWECGKLESEDNLTYLENYDRYVCKDCLEDKYETCHDCGEYNRFDDMRETAYGYSVCEDCRDRDYSWCDDCGRLYYSDEVNYNENTDEWYCDNCWDRHELDGRIYDYHEFNDWEFYKASDEEKPPFYIGHELEVENYDNDSHCIDTLYNNLNVILAHDGSINNGFEIISHPQSYKYIMEHKETYRDVFNEMINSGYRSHKTDTCGLHFHVTRPFYNEINNIHSWSGDKEELAKRDELIKKQNEVIDRIILVMETYKEELIAFSRRKSGEMHWCQFLSDYKNKPSGEIKSLYYIKKNKETNTRYMALNLENYATIEFRIFKGTLKYETFMASVELVNNIMTLCSNLELPVTEITWDKLIDSEFAREYCIEKDIHTDKRVVDNSKEEIDLENKIKAALKKTYKDLLKVYNAEVKRISSEMRVSLNDNLNNIYDKVSVNYRNLQGLIDLTSEIANFIDRIKREEIDVNNIKNRIESFITGNNYNARIINWTLYEDIKNKLNELINN